MFNMSRLIVASVRLGALEAEPPKSNTDISAVRIAAPTNRLVIPVLPSYRISHRDRQLPLDQPVHVPAQVHELGQLLRRDLIARALEVDLHDLLHFGGRVCEHDDAVREVDRLVYVVRDEQDRDAVLLANAQQEIFELR